MSKENMPDVLVLGAGPAGMAIASALGTVSYTHLTLPTNREV